MTPKFSKNRFEENKQLIKDIEAGKEIVVEFTDTLLDEVYLEKGTRAVLTSMSLEDAYATKGTEDDLIYEFTFNFKNFDDYNLTQEKPNWCDDNGDYILTATEAGYKPQNFIETHFYSITHLDLPFTIINNENKEIFEKYKREVKTTKESIPSYISWLENRIISLEKKGN